MGLGRLLQEKASSEKDRIFFHFEDKQESYAELFKRVCSWPRAWLNKA